MEETMQTDQALRIYICLNQLMRLAEEGNAAKLKGLVETSDYKELKRWTEGKIK